MAPKRLKIMEVLIIWILLLKVPGFESTGLYIDAFKSEKLCSIVKEHMVDKGIPAICVKEEIMDVAIWKKLLKILQGLLGL